MPASVFIKLRMTLTAALALALVIGGAAQASTGPLRLQQRAVAQTKLLFRHLKAPQTASPARCNEGQRPSGIRDAFLLPTLSFGTGDETFNCRVTARTVVLDLGGAIASEDARGDRWPADDPDGLLFTRANLEAICDDVLQFFPTPSPATVDSTAIGGAQVSTRAFTVKIRRGAPAPYYQDSVDVGHPGRLAASFCGWKAEIPLSRGYHVIQVDHSAGVGAPTHFTYRIWVKR